MATTTKPEVGPTTSESRMEFLARASAELASSLDYEETLRTVARLAVPLVPQRLQLRRTHFGTIPRSTIRPSASFCFATK